MSEDVHGAEVTLGRIETEVALLMRLGEATPESLLEAQELYDNHFLRSEVWDTRH